MTNKDMVIESDGQENIPEGPVVFAHTHQGLLDNFAWNPTLKRHAFVLHGATCRKLLIFAQLNTGLVLVSKEDSPRGAESRKNAKLDMIQLLREGHSIIYFPESTWNLSPNKLRLSMSYGPLDVAKKAGVPVVPVVDEYTYDTSTAKENVTRIRIRYGKPIYVKITDNYADKLQELQEQISTLRYQLLEEMGIYCREKLTEKE